MALGEFEIHAGDFKTGKRHHIMRPALMSKGKLVVRRKGKLFRETIKLNRVASVEVATEESVKRLGGTLGWGAAGAVLLGPVGLLAGLLAGGKSSNVTFVCQLDDGHKFMGTMTAKDYKALAGAAFK